MMRGSITTAQLLSRTVAVIITIVPALTKILSYGEEVTAFQSYGIPFAELAVPLAAAAQLVAIVSIAAGLAGRYGAGLLAGTMTVAIAAAGLNPFNGAVFVASVVLVVLGTGRFSVWNAGLPDVVSVVEKEANASG